MALTKLGVKRFDLWDPDVIEEVNLGPQVYTRAQLDRGKAAALGAILVHNAPSPGLVARPLPSAFVEDSPLPEEGLIVVAPDSMAVRRLVARRWAVEAPSAVLMDLRMGGMAGEAHVLRRRSPYYEQYRGCLQDPDDTFAQDPCGARSSPWVGMVVAGRAVALLRAVLLNEASGGWWTDEHGLVPAKPGADWKVFHCCGAVQPVIG